MQIPHSSSGFYHSPISLKSTLIPHHWYFQFTSKRGAPDYDLITILSDIVYWYRPSRVTNPVTGKTHLQNKFKGNLWQTSYSHFQRKFGFSHEKVRRALVKLEQMRIIKRIFKTIIIDGQKYNNRLFIFLCPKFLQKTLGNKCRNNNPIATKATNEERGRSPANDEVYIKTLPSLPNAELEHDTTSDTHQTQSVYTTEPTQLEVNHKITAKDKSTKYTIPAVTNNAVKQATPQETKQTTVKTLPEQPKQSQQNDTLKFHQSSNLSKVDPSPHLEGDHIISNKENIINLDKIDNNTQVSARGGRGELSISNFRKKSERKSKGQESINTLPIPKSQAIPKHLSPTNPPPPPILTYKTPKTLADFYPLFEEDASHLRNTSNREFSLHAMNEILKSLIKKLQNRIFYTKQAFLSYMSKIFAHEMRQAAVINNNNFRIVAGMSDEEKQEQAQEKYLAKLEQSSSIAPEDLLKKRLAALLPKEKAYELLQGLRKIEIEKDQLGNKLKLYHFHSVVLTSNQQQIVISQATEIYSRNREMNGEDCNLEKLELIVTGGKNSKRLDVGTNSASNGILPFTGTWGKIRKELIKYYDAKGENGGAIDRSWFSKLEACVDNKTCTITLKAPSKFIRDWVMREYWSGIKEICKTEEYDLVAIS